MKRFHLIEHTADTGIVAYGNSLAEAFTNVAYGLFTIIAEIESVAEINSREVTVTAGDIEELLFNWLNELIYIFEVEHLLLKRFDISELTDIHLKANCRGEPYDASRHRLKTGVKSATYHMLEVDREKNRVQVILDV
ncbi:archease [Bacteroidota bacterium]